MALTFIEAYASAFVKLNGLATKVLIMAAVIGLQLRGARDAAKPL